MEDRDAPRLQPAWRFAGLHRHDLADGQLVAAGRFAVLTQRRLAVEVHFHAVHADGAESGDGSHNARAPDPSFIGRCTGTADSTFVGRCAGTTNAAVIDWRSRTADTASGNGARASHAARFEADRCGAQRGRRQQQRAADEGEGAQQARGSVHDELAVVGLGAAGGLGSA
ncbi:hypothetical protein D9M71_584200 [compost metagenome]